MIILSGKVINLFILLLPQFNWISVLGKSLILLIYIEDMCQFNAEVHVENTKYIWDEDDKNLINDFLQNKRLA